jgi:hypothetical protein
MFHIVMFIMHSVLFRYYYNMYGKGMGTLNIYYLQKNNIQMIKTISGNKGQGWAEDTIPLHVKPKQDFQVRLKPTRPTLQTTWLIV